MEKCLIASSRSDPYKNFKFKVIWLGRYVAGFSDAAGLDVTPRQVDYRNGSDPRVLSHTAGRTRYEPLTLDRGTTHDAEFENWAANGAGLGSTPSADNLSQVSRKEIVIELRDETGEVVGAYSVHRARVSEYQAAPDLNGNARAVAIQHLRLEHEGVELLAQTLEQKFTWADGHFPPEVETALREIVSQTKEFSEQRRAGRTPRKKNRGMRALFVGEARSGRPKAFQIIAGALHRDLYRIDLSAVVGKYVGETEKNLRRLFEAAEDSGVVLFFDEADALFGKRSEVKDSHDRYSHGDIDYLLQRLEDYHGLAIVATNSTVALDDAVRRRFRYVVHFPSPPSE